MVEKQHTDVRQEQILQAALHLVSRRGLKDLTIARLAEQVGLAPSAIYRHFANKDAIIDAALAAFQGQLLRNVALATAEHPDPLARLRGVVMRHVQLVLMSLALPHVLFSDEVLYGPPERLAKLREIPRTYLAALMAIIAEGQAQGQIRPELDPQTVAMMSFALVMPGAMLFHTSGGQFDIVSYASRAWDVLAAGLKVQP